MTEETCYMHFKMLLKLGTGNGERGKGNQEPEFGNEFTAVICLRR